MKISEIIKNKKTLSFEVFPPKKEETENIAKIYATIDRLKELNPDFISVTYGANGSNSKNTVAIASYLKNIANIEPLAHVTGGPLDYSDVDLICKELKENNIENILALRGDKPVDYEADYLKVFKHASDLTKYIKGSESCFCLGGACYPEGHIDSSTLHDDLINLKLKQDSGAEFLISQIFFDNDYFYRLIRDARKIGITVPIIPGIMPLVNSKQIARVMSMTGCTIPLSLRTMIERFKDDKSSMREIGINYTIYQILDLLSNDVDGIHLYIMNNASVAEDIISKIKNVLKKEMKSNWKI